MSFPAKLWHRQKLGHIDHNDARSVTLLFQISRETAKRAPEKCLKNVKKLAMVIRASIYRLTWRSRKIPQHENGYIYVVEEYFLHIFFVCIYFFTLSA